MGFWIIKKGVCLGAGDSSSKSTEERETMSRSIGQTELMKRRDMDRAQGELGKNEHIAKRLMAEKSHKE